MAGSEKPVVLFDGQCSFCLAAKRWTERLDPIGTVEWVASQTIEPMRYGLTREQVDARLYVVSGDRHWTGFEAWKVILRRHPFIWAAVVASAMYRPYLLLPWALFFSPLAAPAGERVYDWVASNRNRMPGATCSHSSLTPGTIER